MRLRVISDLHMDCCQIPRQPEAGFDLAVVAGDSINLGRRDPAWLVEELCSKLPEEKILMVMGNHEGYGAHDYDRLGESLAKACEGTKAELLNRSASVWGGVRFLGAPLWTDFELFGPDKKLWAMGETVRALNDFRLIGRTGRIIRGHDALEWHVRDLEWLRAELSEPFEGKTAVVTHHAPRRESLAPCYARDVVSAGFVSHLDDELFEACDLWVHGHTHTSFDYMAGRCRVVCNPRGYTNDPWISAENPKFSYEFEVEL